MHWSDCSEQINNLSIQYFFNDFWSIYLNQTKQRCTEQPTHSLTITSIFYFLQKILTLGVIRFMLKQGSAVIYLSAVGSWWVDCISSADTCRARQGSGCNSASRGALFPAGTSCPSQLLVCNITWDRRKGRRGRRRNSAPQEDSSQPLSCVALHIRETTASVMCPAVCIM